MIDKHTAPGTKVKIPTKCTDTSSTYEGFKEEFNVLVHKPDYLYFVGDFMGSAEVSLTTKRDTLNCCLFSYEDLELYEEPMKTTSAINPSHYQANGVQVMDQMLAVFGVEKVKAFCEVNAFKYRMRAGKKKGNPPEQDIEKALWYENKLKELTPTEGSFNCLGEL